MKRITLISLLFISFLDGETQQIPLETWRTHFSYVQVKHLTATPDKIFCAAENGLFYYDLEDNSVNKLGKLDGLSDVGISAMGYSNATNTIVIGYSSGNIDLITEDGIINIDDFKLSNLVTDKSIKDIVFYDSRALIATSLGVIVVSINNQEIIENYRSIGTGGEDAEVSYLYIRNDTLVAITNLGIQSGPLNKNLLDFNNWKRYPETENQKNAFLGSQGSHLYSIKNDSVLLVLKNGTWSENGLVFPNSVRAFSTHNNSLYVTTEANVFQFDGISLTLEYSSSNGPINDLLVEEDIWLGTEQGGLLRKSSEESIYPNGPIADGASNVVTVSGETYLFFGPDPSTYNGESDGLGYNVFDGNDWKYREIQGFYNLSDIVKWREGLYFSSIGDGIYSATENRIFNQNNSTLTNSKNGNGPIITDLVSGSDLWVASYDNTNPIATLNTENLISNFPETTVGTDEPIRLALTLEGPILIQNSTANGGGIIGFDPPSIQKRFTTASDLPSNNIKALIIDQEDGAWVGTTNGLVAFPDASFIIDFPEPVTPVFENSLLFEGDEIYALAADGGNRIWVSTREGLWVFNRSLTEIVHFFTEENSPLPSTQISLLEYQAESGEMYIQTDKGLVSFRSSSSQAKSGYNEVSIFPNPVRPGYTGLVGISGLVYNTLVKITNIDGKLIKEIATNGGTASWDLLDYNNQKVESGVYFVFTSSVNGEEKYVGKIAVVN